MRTIQKLCRIEETLMDDIKAIAKEQGTSENQTVETALKFYRDYHHMQNKATFINVQILNVFQASIQMLENSINQRSNQLISELAIQSAIQNYIIAEKLEDVTEKDLHRYRIQAVDFLKQKQRIFRMDEAYE